MGEKTKKSVWSHHFFHSTTNFPNQNVWFHFRLAIFFLSSFLSFVRSWLRLQQVNLLRQGVIFFNTARATVNIHTCIQYLPYVPPHVSNVLLAYSCTQYILYIFIQLPAYCQDKKRKKGERKSICFNAWLGRQHGARYLYKKYMYLLRLGNPGGRLVAKEICS